MKLSEAIMLGSTQLRLEPSFWICEDGGCLIGLGGYAVGVRYEADYNKRICDPNGEIRKITAMWPWLDNKFTAPEFLRALPHYPTGLPFTFMQEEGYAKPYFAKCIISALAAHVKLGNLTLEQAVDWIRANEPQEATQPETTEEENVCEPVKL